MLKHLLFESARHMKATMSPAQYNNKAGFDRMHRAGSNIILRKANVDKNVLIARSLNKGATKRTVKMGLGISDGSYKQNPRGPEMDGEV